MFEVWVRLILEDAVGLATVLVADKTADVRPVLQLAMLLLGFERPRPTASNTESRNVGASTREGIQRCRVQPRIGRPVAHMAVAGRGPSPQLFVCSGIEQSSTHALYRRAANPLRFAVTL